MSVWETQMGLGKCFLVFRGREPWWDGGHEVMGTGCDWSALYKIPK